MNKKTLILSALALGLIVGVSANSVRAVSAQSDDDSRIRMTSRIAERFNLDESEVQEVFQEAREDKMAKKAEFLEMKLDKAVEEGTLTQAQADEFLAMTEEFHADRADLKDMDPEERKELLRERREEVTQWFNDNDLEPTDLFPGLHVMKHKKGHKMGEGHSINDEEVESISIELN